MLYRFNNKQPTIGANSFVAPSADLIGDVRLGEGVSVWFGAVLRGDMAPLVVGNNSNVQDGTVMHADAGFPVTVGNNVTIGHRATIHGCTIGDGSLIGMGATLLNGVVVGKECLIAAGAVVSEGMKIADRSVVMGVPAKVVKTLSDALAERLKLSSKHYDDLIPVYNGVQGLKKLEN